MVDDLDGDDFEVRQLVDAAQTPPFLTDIRIVVGFGIGRFKTDEIAPLLAYLTDPLPSTQLVLIGGGGRMPKALTDSVAGRGRARDRDGHSDPQEGPLGLDRRAAICAVGLRFDKRGNGARRRLDGRRRRASAGRARHPRVDLRDGTATSPPPTLHPSWVTARFAVGLTEPSIEAMCPERSPC